MRTLQTILILAGLLMALAGSAAAQQGGDIVVGGVKILTIRAALGGMTIEQRVVIIRQRITNALSIGPVRPADITVRTVNGTPAVFARDILIITADAEHARLNATTPQALAEIWAENLRRGLPGAVPRPAPTQ